MDGEMNGGNWVGLLGRVREGAIELCAAVQALAIAESRDVPSLPSPRDGMDRIQELSGALAVQIRAGGPPAVILVRAVRLAAMAIAVGAQFGGISMVEDGRAPAGAEDCE